MAHEHTVSVGARDGSGGIDQAFAGGDDELVLEVRRTSWNPHARPADRAGLPES